MAADAPARPVIGISANVVDERLTGGRIDGIGVYTRALIETLPTVGFAVEPIHAPTFAGVRLRPAPAGSLSFAVPLPIATLLAVASGLPVPGAREVESRIDLYHATDYRAPKLRRTPVVATLYDAIPHMRPEWGNPRLRRVKNILLRAAAKFADLVIVTSQAAVAEIVEHYRVPPQRIRVVPLGIGPNWFMPPMPEDIQAALAARGLSKGYFLAVGTLQPRKNYETLLRAYDQLPPAIRRERQLVIVGKYGWGAEALRADLLARRDGGRCVWLDYEDDATLRALYAGAGGFVFPTWSEGFGLPALEALATGLPIVASDLPVLREVAGDHAMYIDPANASGFAEAMDVTAGLAPESKRIEARRARARRFSWEACARQTGAVYRELLTQGHELERPGDRAGAT
jgi:glycosyltransferase involved in cell wall biosynthesis